MKTLSRLAIVMLGLLAPLCAQQTSSNLPLPTLQESHRYGYFGVRGPDDPQLASNKDVFKSRTFLIAHGIYLTSEIVDSRFHREPLHTELPAALSLTALDYVAYRFIWKPLALAGPIVGTEHYLQDAFRGRQ